MRTLCHLVLLAAATFAFGCSSMKGGANEQLIDKSKMVFEENALGIGSNIENVYRIFEANGFGVSAPYYPTVDRSFQKILISLERKRTGLDTFTYVTGLPQRASSKGKSWIVVKARKNGTVFSIDYV